MPMKETAEESAELKMALKHSICTDHLRREAEAHPLEADEAYFEVINGHDSYEARSWVAEELAKGGTIPR